MSAEHVNEALDDHDAMPDGEEPPPRGAKTMAVVRWVIVVVAGLLALGMWLSYAKAQLAPSKTDTSTEAPKYQCPMHPQIVSNEPGECPICHMTLEPISAERGSSRMTDAGSASPAPPSLEEVKPAADAGTPVAAMTPGTTPPGTTPIKLTLDRVQSIGVRTAVAEERDASKTLRVTAVVMAPEQGVAEVHARSAGFVEAIQVDQTGIAVRMGQPMLSLYSPELLQAQNELLATRQWAGDAGATSSSARRKLELLGMAPREIDGVIAKGEPLRAVTITTPRGGFVSKKNVVLGSYVTPETVLYEVQDLSKVYVVADLFLPDVGTIGSGTEGRFVPSGHADRAATAKVDLVYPNVGAEARTRRVRMQIKNDGGKLYAPGEYGTVELATTGSRKRVSIPRDALIDTGTATYVFVVEPDGRFVPRVVSTSAGDADRVVVDAGIAPGERVVSGATFLIDSESRLQASIAQATQAAQVDGGK